MAFVSGLSDKKLAQKLAPLQAIPEVLEIDLYRRQPFSGEKIRWMKMPNLCTRFAPLGDLWRLVALIKNAHRYDILIGCHQRYHGVYAAVAGVLLHKKVIQLVTTDPAWIKKSFMGGWTLRHAVAVGFRGRTTLEAYKKNCRGRQIFFIPQNVWQPSERTNGNGKTIDLLYAGNFDACKNILGWIQIAAAVKRQRGFFSAVIIGERLNKDLLKLLNRLQLKNDVTFTGPLHGKELDKYYAAARVFLLTSFWEGLPMVAVESMNFGVPVVATDVGDTRDLVEDGKNGYLTEVGDTDAAARAVVRLLNDDELYRRMSANAYKKAEEFLHECTIEHVSKIWRDVFVELGLIEMS
ncbi:MAG: glycosyltransferase family 4 protein [Bacteroidales bacterium]|nr:glycosyltransferase family 4 protein [Bacteroidales bacterium]